MKLWRATAVLHFLHFVDFDDHYECKGSRGWMYYT